jgi:hypothetical protein
LGRPTGLAKKEVLMRMLLKHAAVTALVLSAMALAAWWVGPRPKQPSTVSDAGVDTRIDDADGCPAFAMMSVEAGGSLRQLRVVRVRKATTGFGCMILDPGTTLDEEMRMWEADNWGNPRR